MMAVRLYNAVLRLGTFQMSVNHLYSVAADFCRRASEALISSTPRREDLGVHFLSCSFANKTRFRGYQYQFILLENCNRALRFISIFAASSSFSATPKLILLNRPLNRMISPFSVL